MVPIVKYDLTRPVRTCDMCFDVLSLGAMWTVQQVAWPLMEQEPMASCNGEVLKDHTPRANRPLVQEVGETLKKGSTETMDCWGKSSAMKDMNDAGIQSCNSSFFVGSSRSHLETQTNVTFNYLVVLTWSNPANVMLLLNSPSQLIMIYHGLWNEGMMFIDGFRQYLSVLYTARVLTWIT